MSRNASPGENLKHIKKPLSLAEYRQVSDLVYSLILGQATAAYGAEKAYWSGPNAKCVEVAAFTGALLKQKPFKKRFRKIHIRQVEYLAVLKHPALHPDSVIGFWAGNPAVFREKVPAEVAGRLPDMPGCFHVCVVAEDKRGHQWIIDPAGAAEAYHGALLNDDIPHTDPASEYSLGVCLAQGGPPLVIGRISDVSEAVRTYCYRPLIMDLAAAAMTWHRTPGERMMAMDQHGGISIIEWQDWAFWRNAPTELPDNLTLFSSSEGAKG